MKSFGWMLTSTNKWWLFISKGRHTQYIKFLNKECSSCVFNCTRWRCISFNLSDFQSIPLNGWTRLRDKQNPKHTVNCIEATQHRIITPYFIRKQKLGINQYDECAFLKLFMDKELNDLRDRRRNTRRLSIMGYWTTGLISGCQWLSVGLQSGTKNHQNHKVEGWLW